MLLLVLLRPLAHTIAEVHEIGAELGSSRYFVLVLHGKFGSSRDFILVSGDKLMCCFGGLVHVLGARLILIVCSCADLKPSTSISTIVICLILLPTIRIEAVVSAITLVIGLVIY